MFFRYISNEKHIRCGVEPLKDSAGNFVTDDQSMAMMLNKYYSLVFSTTSVSDNINSNYVNSDTATSSASVVDSQEARTVLSDNSNGTANNDDENLHVLE